jgi:hypothetical protein
MVMCSSNIISIFIYAHKPILRRENNENEDDTPHRLPDCRSTFSFSFLFFLIATFYSEREREQCMLKEA